MEFAVPLKTRLIPALLLGLVLSVPPLLAPVRALAQSAQPERALVLVASAESPLEAPENARLRDAWLGQPVEINGLRLKPMRNLAQPQAEEVFLQKVMFMARRRYERNVVLQVFSFGGTMPRSLETREQLEEKLREDPAAVTYMWANAAKDIPGIKILGELWRGTID